MKTIKLMTLMAAVVALGLVSCLSEENDTLTPEITKEQIHQYFLQMAGSHHGKLYYRKNAAINPDVDSTEVSWTFVNDSVIQVHSVPAKALASLATPLTMKEALQEAEPVDIEVRYVLFSLSPLRFSLYPLTAKGKVFYEQATHDVAYSFAYNNYSWGTYEAGKIQMQLVQYGIYLDEKASTSYLTTQALLYFSEE